MRITSHNEYNEDLIDSVYSIDHSKFRKDLWYSKDEIRDMFSGEGFFCLLVYLDEKLIAYDFGYDVKDGIFFSDSTATLIEKKGIGTILAVLEQVYLYENGYQQVRFMTEAMDQDGRPLRAIWEKRGYYVVSSDEKGVTMQLDVTPQVVREQIEKHITG